MWISSPWRQNHPLTKLNQPCLWGLDGCVATVVGFTSPAPRRCSFVSHWWCQILKVRNLPGCPSVLCGGSRSRRVACLWNKANPRHITHDKVVLHIISASRHNFEIKVLSTQTKIVIHLNPPGIASLSQWCVLCAINHVQPPGITGAAPCITGAAPWIGVSRCDLVEESVGVYMHPRSKLGELGAF